MNVDVRWRHGLRHDRHPGAAGRRGVSDLLDVRHFADDFQGPLRRPAACLLPNFSELHVYRDVFSIKPVAHVAAEQRHRRRGHDGGEHRARRSFRPTRCRASAFAARAALGFGLFTTQMLPEAMLVVPLYAIFAKLALLNSLGGLILANTAFTVPVITWILKGAIDGVPIEIEEAARIDGCSRLGIVMSVVIPLIAPTLAAAVGHRLLPRLERVRLRADASSPRTDLHTASVGLAGFVGELSTPIHSVMAIGLIYTLPAVVFYLLRPALRRGRHDRRQRQGLKQRLGHQRPWLRSNSRASPRPSEPCRSSRTSSSTCQMASSWSCSARRAAASPRCCACWPAWRRVIERRDPHQRPARRPTAAERPRHGLRVSVLRALSAHDGAAEHHLSADHARSISWWFHLPLIGGIAKRRIERSPEVAELVERTAKILALTDRAGPVPAHALRRTAAARGAGPRDGAPAAGVPDGRTAVEPGRQTALVDARGDHQAAPASRRHLRLCDARPGRSHDDGIANRLAQGWRGAAIRHARARSTRPPPTPTWRASSARRP